MAEELNLDDIDLDADAADEASKLLEEEVEETEEEETEEEEVAAPEKEEPKDPDPKDDIKTLFEELRAERQRLQDQLNELAVTSLTDRKKLTALEKKVKAAKAAPPKEEPEGPTPQQIMGQLDHRIAQVDAALAKAEAEDPTAAPELRKQLRNLERMANDYRTQVALQSAKGVDPEVLVQQAVLETNQQARFNAVRNHITNQYPLLDPNSEYYDENLAKQVHRVYNPMLKEGEDPADALLEATSLVTAARGVMSIAQLQQLQAQEEAKKAEEAKKPPPKKVASEQRKTDAVKRNVAAAQATPPNIANLGAPNESTKLLDKYDLSSMPINEFLRMSDEEMDRLEQAALSMYE